MCPTSKLPKLGVVDVAIVIELFVLFKLISLISSASRFETVIWFASRVPLEISLAFKVPLTVRVPADWSKNILEPLWTPTKKSPSEFKWAPLPERVVPSDPINATVL